MSRCDCARCGGTVGAVAHPAITFEVTFPVVVERSGWVQTGYGEVWGDYEVTHELRAEVTFRGPNDAPVISPLKPAHWVASLGREVSLSAFGGKPATRNPEWIGADEQAVEHALAKLREHLAGRVAS